MKNTLFAFAVIGALIGTLKGDDAKKTPGEIFAKVPVHRLDGKTFKESKVKKSPEFYILYYSASW